MNEFALLYRRLDETTKTSRKIAAMRGYFAKCDAADGAWAVYFLSGRRLKRLVPTNLMRSWIAEASGFHGWMIDECYDAVGDLAETITLLLPDSGQASQGSLSFWIEQRIQPLAWLDDASRKAMLFAAWRELSVHERFVYNKLVTGGFRVGVSQRLAMRALAEIIDVEPAIVAHRLMGQWLPTADFYRQLLASDTSSSDPHRPYPFCLAHPLHADPRTLGDRSRWIAEWKWDGIRGQIVRRQGESFVWSRGEELIQDRFPELKEAMAELPEGVVLDGEILGWKEESVLPFSDLQRRIGRKTVGKKILAEVPVRFLAFDVLEYDGQDVRQQPLAARREQLEGLLRDRGMDFPITLSDTIDEPTWEALGVLRETSRARNAEGLMLKRADSPYGAGRVTGLWWKWKVDPYTCDAVLIYAQRGSGRRASLYTDYTFAVWDDDQLVPLAKAYSGLTNEEIREVDRFVRANTIEKFGPVRSVTPQLVFELGFENIQWSKRHSSGVAVRFPRILRWRYDKRPQEADTLDAIKAMMPRSA